MAIKTYYLDAAEEICKDIISSHPVQEKVDIQGIELRLLPHVYPSNQFRTTDFLLGNIQFLVENKVICDMGCGLGVVGHFALRHGASRVIQADINTKAVKNANLNKKIHGFSDQQMIIYESDCFDAIPRQQFDLIIFNIPFHTEPHEIKDPLEHAFYDPFFRSLRKFLNQLSSYVYQETLTLICFSNKGDVAQLEAIFDSYKFDWSLWKIINNDKEYDNRIYLLKGSGKFLARLRQRNTRSSNLVFSFN